MVEYNTWVVIIFCLKYVCHYEASGFEPRFLIKNNYCITICMKIFMMFHNPMFTTHLEYEERKKFKEYLNINLTVFIMISDQLYKQNLNS